MAERHDWRDLPPIPEDERVEVPDTPSMTFLRHRDRCHRSAHLYLRHGGGPGSAPLNRGSVFHLAIARATLELIDQDERQPIPERTKDILNEIYAEQPELTVPNIERDDLRGMAHNWSVGSFFPAPIVGVEQMLTLQLGRFTVRGIVDLIEQPAPDLLDFSDYKTSFQMPTSAEWHRGGFDPERGTTRLGGDYQTQLYALLAAFGVTPEGLRIAEGIERFRLFLRFPRYLREEGLAYKEAEVTRLQLTDLRLDVEAQLAGLEASIESGKWQPTPGSHCGQCPSPFECPLPRHLRPESQAAEVETIEDAERLAAAWQFMQRDATALKSVLRAAAERNGWERIHSGTDTALTFIYEEREGLKPKILPRLAEAVEGASRYGHDFNLADFTQHSQATKFDKRKVAPKAPEREDENGNDDPDD